MNCKFCKKELTSNQVKEVVRAKSGGCCSSKCGALFYRYGSKENIPKYNENKRILHKGICNVCNKEFESTIKNQSNCGVKCAGKLSSNRMKINNPMSNIETRKKVSNTLKKINHKPNIRGGNGTGLTIHQKMLFDKIVEIDDSFVCEYIFKTRDHTESKEYPNHYKIDIGSEKKMIAIEVDGNSHNLYKIKQCDIKKENLLNFARWKVLRFTNSQIQTNLESCVQTVLSMI
jgi:hypothetical protein